MTKISSQVDQRTHLPVNTSHSSPPSLTWSISCSVVQWSGTTFLSSCCNAKGGTPGNVTPRSFQDMNERCIRRGRNRYYILQWSWMTKATSEKMSSQQRLSSVLHVLQVGAKRYDTNLLQLPSCSCVCSKGIAVGQRQWKTTMMEGTSCGSDVPTSYDYNHVAGQFVKHFQWWLPGGWWVTMNKKFTY